LGIEYDLYELAHVLFDDFEDEFTAGLNSQQKTDFDFRIRKDRLTNFLGSRIWKRHLTNIREAEKSNTEEAAILHLTAKNVSGACQALISNKDYHLMMLVAQIDQADEVFQHDIGAQIAAWHEQNIISEMSDPVRALYEILSGNTTICQGKSNGPVEDRASTFAISKRFGLDWLQAFSLSLWYGKFKNGTIQEAVQDFAAKLESKEEPTYPYADRANLGEQESPLWVLLKLYASTKSAGFAAPVLPQALNSLSGSFNCRTTFQMHHALTSRLPKLQIDLDKADVLATELAFQLSAAGSYVDAAYALLYVHDAGKRQASIRDLLTRYAAHLPDKPSDFSVEDKPMIMWRALTLVLKIPETWIFEAKALYARSQNESLDELGYLIAAEQWSPAHECLCRRVAPRTVIDEDWELLQSVLHQFGDMVEERVGNWSKGGAIYSDFVKVVGSGQKISMKDAHATLKRLYGSLTEMGQRFKARGSNLTSGGVEELEQRVACKEMSKMVAEMLSEAGGVQVCAELAYCYLCL
jgi:nuclear pore complex protein Nup98-Nup96